MNFAASSQRHVVDLDVLARGDVALVERRVLLDDVREGLELLGRDAAHRQLHADHLHVGLALAVDALLEAEADELGLLASRRAGTSADSVSKSSNSRSRMGMTWPGTFSRTSGSSIEPRPLVTGREAGSMKGSVSLLAVRVRALKLSNADRDSGYLAGWRRG